MRPCRICIPQTISRLIAVRSIRDKNRVVVGRVSLRRNLRDPSVVRLFVHAVLGPFQPVRHCNLWEEIRH